MIGDILRFKSDEVILIDRGLVLVEEIRLRKDELDHIQERLEKIALAGDQIPLEDSERDGMQYIAQGSEKTVPVVITADMLMKSFTGGSAKHDAIEAAAGGPANIREFFRRTISYERIIDDGKLFRRKAREVLGAEIAPLFISACVARDKTGTPRNAVKIDWQRAVAIS